MNATRNIPKFPWTWNPHDGSMLSLEGAPGMDENGDPLEWNVLTCKPCEACNARGAKCLNPTPESMEFIARACNVFDALRDSLTELVNSPNAKQKEMWDRARAVLAIAQEPA